MECKQCGRTLTGDEIAIYKRMVDRLAEECLCKACLAAYFRCEVALIDKKIRQFRELGCALFSPLPEEDGHR